jgi:hypothetical protein
VGWEGNPIFVGFCGDFGVFGFGKAVFGHFWALKSHLLALKSHGLAYKSHFCALLGGFGVWGVERFL